MKRVGFTVVGLSLVLVVAGLAPVVAADHDADRTVDEDYVSAPPVVTQYALDTPDPAPDHGGASHVPVEDDSTVSVDVTDELGNPTLNVVAFYDENGDFLNPPGGTGFCNSIDHVSIPTDAATVSVFVGWNAYFDFYGWSHDCNAETPSPAGTVSLSFAS